MQFDGKHGGFLPTDEGTGPLKKKPKKSALACKDRLVYKLGLISKECFDVSRKAAQPYNVTKQAIWKKNVDADKEKNDGKLCVVPQLTTDCVLSRHQRNQIGMFQAEPA